MVSKEMAQKFADSAKILYFETSAKDSIGIDIIFTSLTEQIAEIKLGNSKPKVEERPAKVKKGRCILL